MSRINARWGWFLRLGIAMGGSGIAISTNCAIAQITPDTTLPSNSIVNHVGNTSIIEGGTQAGSNLFHSFQQFSIPPGNTAFFNNAQDIQNIISRVTGGSPSNIEGLIRANFTANLFLLNPNGIIFGPNARLDIGGSFVGSTASSMKFADNTQFSATASQTTPLLTISVPLGLQFGQTAGSIVNRSRATNSSDGIGLEVKPGKTLALVGGNVNLEEATMLAPRGRIELGAVAGEGTVGLTVDSNNLSLSFPNNIARADVALTDGSSVGVVGGDGSIAINARNIDIRKGSQLLAGIESSSGAAVAGDITLNATEKIAVKESSNIINEVSPGATGNSGNININAKSLDLENAFLSASTFGQGNGGSVKIDASGSVTVDSSTIFSDVQQQAKGTGGNINISSGSFSLTNGAIVSASTYGQGNGGSVKIDALGTVTVNNSAIFSDVVDQAKGNGGNINISSGSLSLTNRAILDSSTYGQGDGGSVKIDAPGTVKVDNSVIFIGVQPQAKGKGGNINISSGSFSLTNGAILSASALGVGDVGDINIRTEDTISLDGGSTVSSTLGASTARRVSITLDQAGFPIITLGSLQGTVFPNAIGKSGNIKISTSSLDITNGARLTTSTSGQGNAGSIDINTTNAARFSGYDTSGLPSGAFSAVQSGAMGGGGDIKITTNELMVDNGAQLVASTLGKGSAGNVTINAGDTVSLSGVSSNGSPSGVFSAVGSTGVGRGGSINVTTGSLSVTNGAQLSANTGGQGDAGNININARDTVSFDGVGGNGFPSSASSAVETGGTDNGGNLTVNAKRVNILNGAVGTVSNQGSGNAGNINLKTDFLNLDNQGKLTANSTSGQGGNVDLQVKDILLMLHNSLILNTSGTAQASGNQGNFTLNTKFLVAPNLQNNDIITNAFNGRGGKIDITADYGVFGFVVRTQQDLERLLGTTDPNKLDSQQLPTNDIAAISQNSPTIITPDIDPSRGLVTLPTVTEVAPKLVASGCAAFNETGGGSNFTITGRGGLPPSPDEPLSSDVVWTDARLPATTTQQHSSKKPSAKPHSKSKTEQVVIAPATGWVFNGKGEVTLISNTSSSTGLGTTPTSCPRGSH